MSEEEHTGSDAFLVPELRWIMNKELTGSHTWVRTCKRVGAVIRKRQRQRTRKQQNSLLIYIKRITTGLGWQRSFELYTHTHRYRGYQCEMEASQYDNGKQNIEKQKSAELDVAALPSPKTRIPQNNIKPPPL